MTDPAHRNLDAEVRAVTEGHRAYVEHDGDRAWIKVVSDTFPGKAYRVDVLATQAWEWVAFICQPFGPDAFQGDHMVRQAQPGVAGCKHAALAARRMEREGTLSFDGAYWVATPEFDFPVFDTPADPFEGL